MDVNNINYWLESNLAALGVAILVTGLLLPKIIIIAFKRKLFDTHGGRKVHRGIVPRLGGISFFPSILFALALVVGLNVRFGDSMLALEAVESAVVPILFLSCSVILLYLIGFADDLVGVRYRVKFFVQIIAGIFVYLSGIGVNDLFGMAWVQEIPDWVDLLLTIFLVVYFVNAINLIDGIDGLASGLAILAIAFYSVLFFFSGEYIYSLIGCATIGALLPFFYYNVFGDADRQKKIFMGDTGSLTVGMILAFLSLAVLRIPEENIGFTSCNRAVLAFTPLIIPCFDVVRVTIHRIRCHRSAFLPDKSHIHHKLLALGMPQKVALAIILLSAITFVILNVWLSPMVNVNLLVLMDIFLWTVGNMIITVYIQKREKKLGKKLYI